MCAAGSRHAAGSHPDAAVHSRPDVAVHSHPDVAVHSRPDEAVRIQFRPASRYTNCRVVIRSGDRVIASLKKPILTPGEMFIREIRAADIDGDIHVEVVL